jgi:TolB-like protein/tetratricopeptide (TPR) repeat protein
MSLFSELKRRNVIRVATAYVVAAWLIIQVVETILPAFGYSDVAIRYIVIVLAIAFIPALIFSWAFEITPEGLKREVEVLREHSITRFTGKKLDRVIMVLLALALGYFAFDKFILDPVEDIQIAESVHQEGRSAALDDFYGDKSIAVLPFVNMSADPDQEYFSDGLSDTLIHVLAQVGGLRVTAKTSSFYFKGQNIDVREIARKLNVTTILEGSVQKSGNRVRVIAQLINAADDTHLWSISFDRESEDIFAVQDEIARAVVEALEVTLLDTEKDRLEQRYRPNLEAYEQFILGRQQMAANTSDSLAAAERYFQQAITLDPDYPLPYVYLSDTLGVQVVKGSLLFEESLKRREPLVAKALELDPLSGEAHLGRARFLHAQQFKTGENNSNAKNEEILKAFELSPNYAEARRWYSFLLWEEGQHEEAMVQIKAAGELDPMSPIYQTAIAEFTWDLGRTEEALTLIRRNIMRTPEFPVNYASMAYYQAQLGRFGEALVWQQEALRRNPVDGYMWHRECCGFLNLGDLPSAEACAMQLQAAHPEKMIAQGMWWLIHGYRGEWDAAKTILVSLLERAPGYQPFHWWLADLVAGQGDIERARLLMAEAFPELLAEELNITDVNLSTVVIFAAILDANGEFLQRDALLLALEERMASMHRIRGQGYGITDVYVHAMRGDRDLAIASLREAIDEGWRGTWYYPQNGAWWLLRQDWKLAILLEDPEFIALMDELEADIKSQRQWFEDNKDKPLF